LKAQFRRQVAIGNAAYTVGSEEPAH